MSNSVDDYLASKLEAMLKERESAIAQLRITHNMMKADVLQLEAMLSAVLERQRGEAANA